MIKVNSVAQGLAISTLTIFLLVACTQGPSAQKEVSTSPSDETIPAGDYFPLRSGAVWVMDERFKSAYHDWLDSPGSPGVSTASIGIVETAGNDVLAHIESTYRMQVAYVDTAAENRPGYVDKVSSVIYRRKPSGEILLEMASPSVSTPLIHLPSDLGSMQTAPASESSFPALTRHISPTIQTATLESNISVPAGTFSQCLKLEKVTTTREVMREDGRTINSTESVAVWLAREVGIVKTQRSTTYNDNSQLVVESRLATYSVPVLVP